MLPTYLPDDLGALFVFLQVKQARVEIAKKKTAEEAKKLEKVKRLGLCPMAFEWIKCSGGYRCAGGSHFVSEDKVNTIED